MLVFTILRPKILVIWRPLNLCYCTATCGRRRKNICIGVGDQISLNKVCSATETSNFIHFFVTILAIIPKQYRHTPLKHASTLIRRCSDVKSVFAGSFQNANNKCADQTDQMRRLVCAFVVRMQQSQVFSRRFPHYFTFCYELWFSVSSSLSGCLIRAISLPAKL